MSYLVIARKYRPVDFDQVVGQETVVKSLKNALTEDRLSHAYLFSGTRGVGKTTVARILARALNCAEGPTPAPCNKCDSCTDILNGSSLDVIEIDGASNRRVEETQQIIENVQYAPARDKFKVYIIDEVHMLSNHAFNALLKTLEEPPRHVVFILATTEYMKVPQTIRSRTQHFHFPNVPQDVISGNLKKICGTEGITISDHALWLISRQASGSVRDAQSLLDQVIAFSGSDISDDKVESVLGVVRGDLLDHFIEAVANADSARLISLTAEIYDSGYDLAIIIRELLERIRNLLLLKIDKKALAAITTLSSEDVEKAAPLADLFTAAQLILIFDILSDAENRMKYSNYSRFIFETALVKASEARAIIAVSKLLDASGGGLQTAGNGGSAGSFSGGIKSGVSAGSVPHAKPRITGLTPYKVMSENEAASFQSAASGRTGDSAIAKKIFNEFFNGNKVLGTKLSRAKMEIRNGNLVILISHKYFSEIQKQVESDKKAADFLLQVCKNNLGPEASFSLEEYIPEDLEKAAMEMPEPAEKQKNVYIDKLIEEPVVRKLIDAFSVDVDNIQVKQFKDSDS